MELKLMSAFAVTPQKIYLSDATLKRTSTHTPSNHNNESENIVAPLSANSSISILAISGD